MDLDARDHLDESNLLFGCFEASKRCGLPTPSPYLLSRLGERPRTASLTPNGRSLEFGFRHPRWASDIAAFRIETSRTRESSRDISVWSGFYVAEDRLVQQHVLPEYIFELRKASNDLLQRPRIYLEGSLGPEMDWIGFEWMTANQTLSRNPWIRYRVGASVGHSDPRVLAAISGLVFSQVVLSMAICLGLASSRNHDSRIKKLDSEITDSDVPNLPKAGRPSDAELAEIWKFAASWPNERGWEPNRLSENSKALRANFDREGGFWSELGVLRGSLVQEIQAPSNSYNFSYIRALLQAIRLMVSGIPATKDFLNQDILT
jgi:hypothetical protein